VRAETAGDEKATAARESGAEAAALQTLREETGVGRWMHNGLAMAKRHYLERNTKLSASA